MNFVFIPVFAVDFVVYCFDDKRTCTFGETRRLVIGGFEKFTGFADR